MVFILLLFIMWKEELSLRNLEGEGRKTGPLWKAAHFHGKSGFFLHLIQAWMKA